MRVSAEYAFEKHGWGKTRLNTEERESGRERKGVLESGRKEGREEKKKSEGKGERERK